MRQPDQHAWLRWVWLGPALAAALLGPPARAVEQAAEQLDQEQARLAYGTEADEVDLTQARLILTDLVNTARREAGLPEVDASSLATRLAQDHADEMARAHYSSHYNLAGEKCELRFNRLGGVDHVAENTAYFEVGYPVRLTPQLVTRMHEQWLASPSHRANLLDPAHTGLGCGLAVVRAGGTAYVAGVEEFVNTYGTYSRLPLAAAPWASLELSGTLDPGLAVLKYVGIGREDLPFPRDAAYQMAHLGGYSPPPVMRALLPRRYRGRYRPDVPEASYSVEYDEASGAFRVSLRLPEARAGAYYVTVWAEGCGEPAGLFCTMTQVILVE